MAKAKLISITDPNYEHTVANIMLEGGIVGAIWGHHLYFLACNAADPEAVKRLNILKKRPDDQVFASPGAIEEAEEFADFLKNPGLKYAASEMKLSSRDYLEFLFQKFPLAVELVANEKAPKSVTFITANGKTIWVAGHMADKNYSKLLSAVRNLSRNGKNLIFAGTSLNLRGENTLTIKESDQVIEDFGSKLEAIVTHPEAKSLKKVRYGTSCSVVSFTGSRPKLLRLGSVSILTLKKYIPGLLISENLSHTRK